MHITKDPLVNLPRSTIKHLIGPKRPSDPILLTIFRSKTLKNQKESLNFKYLLLYRWKILPILRFHQGNKIQFNRAVWTNFQKKEIYSKSKKWIAVKNHTL